MGNSWYLGPQLYAAAFCGTQEKEGLVAKEVV